LALLLIGVGFAVISAFYDLALLAWVFHLTKDRLWVPIAASVLVALPWLAGLYGVVLRHGWGHRTLLLRAAIRLGGLCVAILVFITSAIWRYRTDSSVHGGSQNGPFASAGGLFAATVILGLAYGIGGLLWIGAIDGASLAALHAARKRGAFGDEETQRRFWW
jgi:hypothetical protein